MKTLNFFQRERNRDKSKRVVIGREEILMLISKVLYDAQQDGYCLPNPDMDLRKKADWLYNWLKENVK